MSKKRSKRPAGFLNSVKLRSRAMLLPMAPALARRISMEHHVNLEVLRSGQGEHYHLGSLAQTGYITRLLCQHGYGTARDTLFSQLDEAFIRCRKQTEKSGIYQGDSEFCELLGELLTLHDQQLATVPVFALMLADDKLKKLRLEE
ncbi:hypothetical protein R69746_05997 [Paraburkholderia aspalathi]|nr:hypothetical protein R69746_05997 [Paraburkholderia aspalathi]